MTIKHVFGLTAATDTVIVTADLKNKKCSVERYGTIQVMKHHFDDQKPIFKQFKLFLCAYNNNQRVTRNKKYS